MEKTWVCSDLHLLLALCPWQVTNLSERASLSASQGGKEMEGGGASLFTTVIPAAWEVEVGLRPAQEKLS
jgi:hypothetical protein